MGTFEEDASLVYEKKVWCEKTEGLAVIWFADMVVDMDEKMFRVKID